MVWKLEKEKKIIYSKKNMTMLSDNCKVIKFCGKYGLVHLLDRDVYRLINENGEFINDKEYNYIDYMDDNYFVLSDDNDQSVVIANVKEVFRHSLGEIIEIKNNIIVEKYLSHSGMNSEFRYRLSKIDGTFIANVKNDDYLIGSAHIVYKNKDGRLIVCDNNGNKLFSKMILSSWQLVGLNSDICVFGTYTSDGILMSSGFLKNYYKLDLETRVIEKLKYCKIRQMNDYFWVEDYQYDGYITDKKLNKKVLVDNNPVYKIYYHNNAYLSNDGFSYCIRNFDGDISVNTKCTWRKSIKDEVGLYSRVDSIWCDTKRGNIRQLKKQPFNMDIKEVKNNILITFMVGKSNKLGLYDMNNNYQLEPVFDNIVIGDNVIAIDNFIIKRDKLSKIKFKYYLDIEMNDITYTFEFDSYEKMIKDRKRLEDKFSELDKLCTHRIKELDKRKENMDMTFDIQKKKTIAKRNDDKVSVIEEYVEEKVNRGKKLTLKMEFNI